MISLSRMVYYNVDASPLRFKLSWVLTSPGPVSSSDLRVFLEQLAGLYRVNPQRESYQVLPFISFKGLNKSRDLSAPQCNKTESSTHTDTLTETQRQVKERAETTEP